MAASDHLNKNQIRHIFHGTIRENWKPHSGLHAGTLSSAVQRLRATSDPYSFDFDEDAQGGKKDIYHLVVSPNATVHPHVPEEDGSDLGQMLREGTAPSTIADYDITPYENTGEGGVSYYVNNPKSILSYKKLK